MNTHLYSSDALGDSIPEDEALSLIKSEPDAYDRFQNFAPNDRKTILEFIQGQRGLKITYDPFFKLFPVLEILCADCIYYLI